MWTCKENGLLILTFSHICPFSSCQFKVSKLICLTHTHAHNHLRLDAFLFFSLIFLTQSKSNIKTSLSAFSTVLGILFSSTPAVIQTNSQKWECVCVVFSGGFFISKASGFHCMNGIVPRSGVSLSLSRNKMENLAAGRPFWNGATTATFAND